jgi:hypothetical protein
LKILNDREVNMRRASGKRNLGIDFERMQDWMFGCLIKTNIIEWVAVHPKMPRFPISHMPTSIEYILLTKLLQVSDINHQLNVNKKYEHLSKIRLDTTVGEGFKKVLNRPPRPMATNASPPLKNSKKNVKSSGVTLLL